MAHKDLVAELRERIAPEAGLDPSQLDPRKPLLHLGIGSMELVQIRGMIQSLYALDIEETTLATEEATIDNLAKAIKAGEVPEAMVKAAAVLAANQEAGGAQPGERAHPPPPKHKPPVCCTVQ
mmetsp:Transcript_7480/g.20403  ORF Transcript_7480/g.20403 Transcript_7480/m.20403 type:complete len:123 (+) Transcript_7480:605-973(+)